MELIEGETLEERVHRAGPLDARTTIQIAQQVTSALAAAEKHGLIHRDLKPANLMLVSSDGETAGAVMLHRCGDTAPWLQDHALCRSRFACVRRPIETMKNCW